MEECGIELDGGYVPLELYGQDIWKSVNCEFLLSFSHLLAAKEKQ